MFIDDLTRIRPPQVRARFRPAEFVALSAGRVVVGDHACSVKIVSVEGPGAVFLLSPTTGGPS